MARSSRQERYKRRLTTEVFGLLRAKLLLSTLRVMEH